MSVVISVQDAGPCRKRLEVEVPGAAVEAETERVLQEYRRKARIPGFRQGKAPLSVLRRRYEDDIRQEVIDRLLPRYWKQAETESRLEPLLPPHVERVDLEPGSPLTFVATVETRPEIAIGDITDFDLPEMETEVTAEEIDRTVDGLRREVGTWRGVERAATVGDRVRGVIRELDGEEEKPAQPIVVEVGDPDVWRELTPALEGRSAGDRVEIGHWDGEGEAARERRYAVDVHEVLELELPPLDDELAAKMGPFAGVEELRSDIEKRMQAAKQRERRRRRERALLDQLLERHPVELPPGVVDQEIEELVRDYAEKLARQGVDLEHAGIDWEEARRQARPQAESRVHGRLVLDAVARAEGIEVDEPEFEQALAGIARLQNSSTVAVRQALDRNGKLSSLRAQLCREKALRRLMKDEPEGSAAEAASEGGLDGTED